MLTKSGRFMVWFVLISTWLILSLCNSTSTIKEHIIIFQQPLIHVKTFLSTQSIWVAPHKSASATAHVYVVLRVRYCKSLNGYVQVLHVTYKLSATPSAPIYFGGSNVLISISYFYWTNIPLSFDFSRSLTCKHDTNATLAWLTAAGIRKAKNCVKI